MISRCHGTQALLAVVVEGLFPLEGHATVGTVVLALTAVDSAVGSQDHQLFERRATDLTLERFLVRVGSEVFSQHPFSFVPLAADLAESCRSVVFHLVLRAVLDVVFVLLFRVEVLVARLTPEGAHFGVLVLDVMVQQRLGLERFAAEIAQAEFVLVDRLVRSQELLVLEHLAARWTAERVARLLPINVGVLHVVLQPFWPQQQSLTHSALDILVNYVDGFQVLIQRLVKPVSPLANHADMFLSVCVKVLGVQIERFLAEEVFLAQLAGSDGVACG